MKWSEVTQSCLTLYDPNDYSPPGSSTHGILQARILEWVAISFSNAWKWKVKVKRESEVPQSCLTLCDPMDDSLPGSSVHEILQARVLEWVAISFSTRSSQPRDRTLVSHIAGRRFTIWATREDYFTYRLTLFTSLYLISTDLLLALLRVLNFICNPKGIQISKTFCKLRAKLENTHFPI